jgi:anti-sigma factor RsiW
MGSIIRLHGAPHDEIRALLPWYVTGRLDDREQARVAAHLKTCRACQEELEFERRLEVEVAAIPVDVEHGWTAARGRDRRGLVGRWLRRRC